jgi:solute carrier family 25 (adenine nucleotide translocator) protein 4/5/6/31
MDGLMQNKFVTDFAVAGAAGGFTKTVTAPIERVKLLIQTQDANPLIRSGEVPRYTGMADCFSRVTKEQGFRAFWRGNGANVLRYIPQQAFNLSLKDTLKRIFPKYNKDTEFPMFFATQLASAGLGAAGSLTICYPLDIARTRLASDVGGGKKTFNGIFDCIGKTVAASGPIGLYNGFGASVGGVVAYRGMQLGCFDTIESMNPYRKDTGFLGFFASFCSGMTSLCLAMPLSYPFDTVRRRLQMESDKPVEERIYRTTLNCVRVILRDEGLNGLYKGLLANIVRGAGASCVPVFYEKGKLILGL